MIYGITGLPGNGKTLYALQFVKNKADKEGRPVFYAGIKGLTLPWTEIDPEKWYECPANAIVVIDECQRFFGVRGRGATIPKHASELETHRHLGIDLVLITQSPMLLDNHDRSLIGTHFHVVRNFGMNRATIHEFQQCKDNVLKSRTGSIRHEWSYPKEAFNWYQSAEVHTHKARIPARVWMLLALPFLIAALCWWIWIRWQGKIDGAEASTVADSGAVVRTTDRRMGVGSGEGRQQREKPLTAAEFAEMHTPRITGLQYTAPVYDEVTKPVHAPYPAAAVVSASMGCRAYSQQGTRLDVPEALCRQIADGGFFIAWEHRQAQVAHVAPVSPVSPEPVPAMAGSLGGRPRLDMSPGPSPRYDGFVEQSPAPNHSSRPTPPPTGT